MTEYMNDKGTRWKAKQRSGWGWGIIRIRADSKSKRNLVWLTRHYHNESYAQTALDEMAKKKGYIAHLPGIEVTDT